MNQSVLFNDDIHFNEGYNAWSFTGFLNGERIVVIISSETLTKEAQISDDVRFDWEEAVENWLNDDEPDEKGLIYINYD